MESTMRDLCVYNEMSHVNGVSFECTWQQNKNIAVSRHHCDMMTLDDESGVIPKHTGKSFVQIARSRLC